MKKGTILGNIWEVQAEADFIRYYEEDMVVFYVDDPETEGYWLISVDDNDNVVISEWVNGEPQNWVQTTEYYDYRRGSVGELLFWKNQICQGIA